MLALDTTKLKAFCETLEVLSPSEEIKILQFTLDLLRNASAFENRIKTLTDERDEALAKLEEQDAVEESAYEVTDEEEDDGES